MGADAEAGATSPPQKWRCGTESHVDAAAAQQGDLSPAEHDRALQIALMAAIDGSSNDAIVSKTLDGHNRAWNAVATRFFGYRAAEVLGKSIQNVISSAAVERRALAASRAFAGLHDGTFIS